MKILPLIAALLFTPVAFSQVSMGGNVIIGMPGPAGPAGTNGTNGTPGPNCNVNSPAGTCDLGTNTLLAGAVTAANVPVVVNPVAGDISAPLNAAVANCVTAGNCSFLISATGQINMKDQIVIKNPNVSIMCQDPSQTTLFGNALPSYTNASFVLTNGIASVATTTPNTYVVGSFIFVSDGAGHSFNGYVNTVTDNMHYTIQVNNIDLPLVHGGISQAISYFQAEADNFELANCSVSRGSGQSSVVLTKVHGSPWSTANNAKIHDNTMWSPYPNASTWGYAQVLPWEPGRSYPTGSKVYGLNGTTTKYLEVATTGGVSGLAHVTAYSQTGTDVTLTANNTITGAAPLVTVFCASGPVWLNQAQGRLAATSVTPTSMHVTSAQSLTSASGAADCTISQASGTAATAPRTTPPVWNTTPGGTTQDGTVTWTTEQTMTNDGGIGIQVVGWDTAHTANNAQVYRNTLNFSFIDLAVDTNANNTDVWGNIFYQGEAFDVNGDRSWVTGTHIHDNWMLHTGSSSWIQDGDHTTLSNNLWWDFGALGVPGVIFSNPYFGFYNTDNIIDGDQFVGSTLSGSAIKASQTEMGLTIQNVNVSYAGTNGIEISQGNISSFGTHIKGVTLKDNGQASPGTGTYCGIHIVTGSSATRLNLDITNSTAMDDQPVITTDGVAANTTQAYAVCADQSSPPGTAIKYVFAYGNNFPVTAWSTASGNGTAFKFPDGCTSCALNPTLPTQGAGTALATTTATTTVAGNVARFADTIGTIGVGLSPTITINTQPCTLGGSCTITAVGSNTVNTPLWLQFLGDGSDGANTTASGNMNGEKWYTNFTVPFGSTVTATGPLVIHATGTCTIAGTITANGTNTGPGYGGGSGGGSGGGTLAGTAASPSYPATASPSYTLNNVAGGTAGAVSGGNGGNGATLLANAQKSLAASGGVDGSMFMGSPGKAGGSTGGAAGANGWGVTLVCTAITGTDGSHTGTINANGTNGGDSTGNNVGAGSGGGGGVVILSSALPVSTWPTVTVAGGNGGSCLSFTGCGTGGNGGAGWFTEFSNW